MKIYRPDLQEDLMPEGTMAPRAAPRDGYRVMILNNGKPKTIQLLGYLIDEFKKHRLVASVEMHSKPSAGSPIDDAVAAAIAARSDVVIAGLGDCGSCSSCSLIDAVTIERLGVPAAVVITDVFVDVCSRVARRMGYPDYPTIVVPHPAASRSDEWLRNKAKENVDALLQMVAPQDVRVPAFA